LDVPGEDKTNPLLVMKCKEYFYHKVIDVKNKTQSFELFFIYPLAISDLYKQLMENRTYKFNFSEDQTINFLFQILKGLKQLKEEHGIKHRDLKP
jgi:serine/threonine protein kinase